MDKQLPSSVRRGGRDIKKNAAKPPLMERTGWSLLETVSVSDHPVCAAAEASRNLFDGAATAPREEGTGGIHAFPLTAPVARHDGPEPCCPAAHFAAHSVASHPE